MVPIASGHEPSAAVAVSNITDHSIMHFVEIAKPAKHVPQENAKSSKRPRLAQGSPAPAEGSR